jgi:chemotaxis protein MotB
MDEESFSLKPRTSSAGVIAPWLVAALAAGAGGYGYFAVHRPLAEEVRQKDAALNKAAVDVKRSGDAALAAQNDLAHARDELQQARTDLAQSAAQKDADQKLLDDLKKQVGAGGGDVQGGNGQITVTMVDKVLFKSGEADLSPEGEEVLRKLGVVLKGADKSIEVAGHADNTAVKSEIRELYPTNWELSTARATNVVRFLQDDVKLNPRHMKAAGYGSYRPVASNGSAGGRAKNRRIEILLLPNKIKTVKGDFSDELAAADSAKKSAPHAARATDKQRLKAVLALRKKPTARAR